MSTRAIYTVIDGQDPPVNIYIHHDGSPTGAAAHIRNAFPHAWVFPHFEGDEFAAALVAGNKSYFIRRELELLLELEKLFVGSGGEGDAAEKVVEDLNRVRSYGGGGGVRIFKSVDPTPENLSQLASDIEYRYELRFLDGELQVRCMETSYWENPTETELFNGTFKAFDEWAAREKAKEDLA